MTSFVSAEDGRIWIKFRRLVQNDMSTAVIWSKSKPDVEFQYGGRLGEFHGMSSQSHVSHCIGEFTVMIPEPHATLQGVIIPSAILEVVFRQFFLSFNAVWALTSGGFCIVSDTLVVIVYAARCYARVAVAVMRCVCVSVCVSVTFVDSVKTNKHIFNFFTVG